MPTRQGGVAPAHTQNIRSILADPSRTPTRVETFALEPEIELYPREVNLDGSTRHSKHCQGLFNRRDLRCHRCMEILAGALPRESNIANHLLKRIGQFQRSFIW